MQKADWKSICREIMPLAIILGLFGGLGYCLEKNGQICFASVEVYLQCLLGVAGAFALLFIVWHGLNQYGTKKTWKEVSFPEKKIHWIILYLSLVFFYTISFLAVFPGFFAYDATMAYNQVFYRTLTSQHPWIHTLILGYICQFSQSHLGHANVGIATYIYIQMLFVAGAFTYTLSYVKKKLGTGVVFFFAVGYYVLSPLMHMFALCSTKDTLFSAIGIVLLVMLLELFEDSDLFLCRPQKVISFVILFTAFLILRKNAVYAYIVFLPFLFVLMKKNRKKVMGLAIVALLLFLIYDIPVTRMAKISGIGPQESLSVPSQQLARVYHLQPEKLTVSEKEKIDMFYPEEYFQIYLPKLADYSKGSLNREYFSKHIGEYIKLWAGVGIKAPGDYVNSFLINTYGFWYPFATLDGYTGFAGIIGTPLEGAEAYNFAYETEYPGERFSLIPAMDKMYLWLSTKNLNRRLPILSFLFSPGAALWFFGVAMWYGKCRGREIYKGSFCLTGLLWLTVLLGPIALIRYVLILFFGVPIWLSAMFERGHKIEEQ